VSSRLDRWKCLLLAAMMAPTGWLLGQGPVPAFPSMEAPRIGQPRAIATEVKLKVGHAEIAFSGAWAPLERNGKVLGFYLKGSGEFTYTSTFEPEGPVVARNLKEWCSEKAADFQRNRTVKVLFTEGRIFLAGMTGFSPDGSPAESLDGAYGGFKTRWDRVDDHVPLHLLAQQESNAPSQPVLIAELEEGGRKWLYTFDGVDQLEETLRIGEPFRGSDPELKGWEYLVKLSSQYIGWDPRKALPPVHFQVSGLDVDLQTRDNREVTMAVEESILTREAGQQVFRFELWNDLVLEKDTRHLKLRRILDGEGKPVAFSHTHDCLAVYLPAPAAPAVPFTLRFEYEGDFLIRPASGSYWQLGVRAAWYPMPVNLSSESYLFHGVVRTTGDWTAFLPGDTVRRVREGEWNVVETRTTKPINFATILGGKYFLDEETQAGLTVRIATYATKPGDVNKVFKSQAFNIIKYYQNFLGPFPFKEFLIVEKNEWGYGQAPPGMMYITRDAFEQAQNVKDWEAVAELMDTLNRRGYSGRLSVKTMDVRHVFAHEIAHQYWGIVVKMPSPLDQWITESFADFCAALYDGDYKGKSRFEKNVSMWRGQAGDSSDKAPIPLANELIEKDSRDRFFTHRNLLYAKGPTLLNALYQEVGDRVFLTWLKSAQATFRWKFATTKQMFDLLSFITKKDYTPFYETYYWGLQIPPSHH